MYSVGPEIKMSRFDKTLLMYDALISKADDALVVRSLVMKQVIIELAKFYDPDRPNPFHVLYKLRQTRWHYIRHANGRARFAKTRRVKSKSKVVMI